MLHSIAAFLTSNIFGLDSSLVPEFKPDVFHYNFSSESGHELLKILYPDVADFWYSDPQTDLNLSNIQQKSLARHLITSCHFADLKQSAINPLVAMGKNLHSFFYSISSNTSFMYLFCCYIFEYSFLPYIKKNFKFSGQAVIWIYVVDFVFFSFRNGQNLHQSFTDGLESNYIVDRYQNDSENALILESTVIDLELSFAHFLISHKERFLLDFIGRYQEVDLMFADLMITNDYIPSIQSCVEVYLITRKVIVYLDCSKHTIRFDRSSAV
ncbi:hypothetical protein GEMRC1_005513 [Eukaryota sp. GEM-RC1]